MTASALSSPPQLCMMRPTLEKLGAVAVPAGYAIRTSREGDCAHWSRIISEAFASADFDEAFFEREMRGDPVYRPERIFFVCDAEGRPCGTASAYRRGQYGSDAGYLHYVGVTRAHAGRGLGEAVSLAVLHRFKDEGLTRAALQTDDFRLPAIRTYLKLGFEPMFTHESHPERWRNIVQQLEERKAAGG